MSSTQPEPVSLAELFSKQPDQITEEDLKQIVTVLRAARENWETEKVEAQKKGKRSPKPSAGISAASIMKNKAIDDLFDDPEFKSLMEG